MWKRILSILLILTVFFTMPLAASAAEQKDSPYDDLGYLGSKETGYLLPDVARGPGFDQTVIDGGTTYSLLFSITANEVYNLLTSRNGNKSFTLSSLPSGTKQLYLCGRIYQADIPPSAIKSNPLSIGICYWDPWVGQYISEYKILGYSGDVLTGVVELSRLENWTTYYTFIKNESSNDTYVYGGLGLYYA